MNKNEFLEEVKKSGKGPENFEKIYQNFQYYQNLAFDTLVELARICSKYRIPYQLSYGSLLGAVRDGGQIPWDYDIDVFVPHEYRKELVEALTKDLKEEYYFYCPEVNAKCRHEILRVTPKGYKSEKLHVDVFYVVGVSGFSVERNKVTSKIISLSSSRFYKLVDAKEEFWKQGKYRRLLKCMIKRILLLGKSVDDMHKEYIKICDANLVKGAVFCATADKNCARYILPAKEMWKLQTIKIDGYEFNIPSNYEEILKVWYGNYREYPSLDSRLTEMMVYSKNLQTAKID